MEARNRTEPDGLGHFLTLGSFLCNVFRRTEEEFHFTIVLGNPGRLPERRNNSVVSLKSLLRKENAIPFQLDFNQYCPCEAFESRGKNCQIKVGKTWMMWKSEWRGIKETSVRKKRKVPPKALASFSLGFPSEACSARWFFLFLHIISFFSFQLIAAKVVWGQHGNEPSLEGNSSLILGSLLPGLPACLSPVQHHSNKID